MSPLEGRKTLPRLTDRYDLGTQGLRVSPFCFGHVDDPRMVCEAFDAGVNFFFLTADMHWPHYEGARRGLEMLLDRSKRMRDEIVVAVVSYVAQPEFCHAPFREVIDAVRGLGRVDVTVIGGTYKSDLMPRLHEYEMHRLPDHLGVKAIGVTLHDRQAAAPVINHELTEIAYIRYNAAHPGAETEIFPKLRHTSKTLVYNFKSTMGHVFPARLDELGVSPSHWRPTIADTYRFALTRPEINGVLFTNKNVEQLRQLIDALEKGPISEKEHAYLRMIADLHTGEAVLD